MKNIVTWFEIPVKDMARAVTFYSKVLSNKIEVVNIMGVDYGMFERGDGIGGSLVKSETKAGKGATLFFFSHDITNSLDKVIVYGGKIVQPKTLMKRQYAGTNIIMKTMIDNEVGYFALVEDSEGNTIALHSHS